MSISSFGGEIVVCVTLRFKECVTSYFKSISGLMFRFSESGQELAHCEEKLELIERSLNSTQDELSSKSADLNRERNANQKLTIELRSAREQNATYEQELSDARNAIGRLVTSCSDLLASYIDLFAFFTATFCVIYPIYVLKCR